MTHLLQDKRVILGVTGSIAAFKAVELASKLTQAGAQVDVILTEAGSRFVTPLSFQSVTGRRALMDADLWGKEGHVLHIGLAHSADLLVIAPASATTIAKLAVGMADNLLTLTALACTAPLLLAPAMDGGMYSHVATQTNLETLRQRGAAIVGPAEGHLASGMVGLGRMVEPLELISHIRLVLARSGPLAGRKVIVTAGGTQEPLDPVRTITNRSSGKQGYALAQTALDLGAEVTLVTAPVSLPAPIGAHLLEVGSAEDMLSAVRSRLDGTDILVMAAAVADFRPAFPSQEKIKKEIAIPQVPLERTPDILQEVAQVKAQTGWPRLTVGFAAESQDLLENARLKLEKKRLDLIVANDISAPDAGFSSDTNRVTIIFAPSASHHARIEPLDLMTKEQVAEVVWERILSLLRAPE